jgi:hypothetical protein
MKNIKPWIANSIWQTSSYPAWKNFQSASKRLKDTQEQILARYIRLNQETCFGRQYGFKFLKTVRDYQERVPLSTYDDYADWINEIGNGAKNVLSSSLVRILEPSSGSTSASKLIPYTDMLRREFQNGISVWIYDLFQQMPTLKQGAAYWSVSPLISGKAYTSGGIPIGFEDDSDYLGNLGKRLVNTVMAVPTAMKQLSDIENFRYATLFCLLSRENLRIISVWNPTFLSLLLEPLHRWWDRLVYDIKNGSMSLPNPVKNDFVYQVPANPKRARFLESVAPTDLRIIWSHLQLISCWMDGPSSRYAQALQDLFSEVTFQAKGLLATEAIVSFPLVGVSGSVLAVNSHFFEFLPISGEEIEGDTTNPKLAHELEVGCRYSVVVTTGAGFYRYLLQDVVEVVGKAEQIPLIRFVAKTNRVSDWFGEKLSETFVQTVLDELYTTHDLHPLFSMLAPSDAREAFHYVLYLQPASDQSREIEPEAIAVNLDKLLRCNFHYDYCRRLGQLQAVSVVLVAGHAQQDYLLAKHAQGLKIGDVKSAMLERTTGWEAVFQLLEYEPGIKNG